MAANTAFNRGFRTATAVGVIALAWLSFAGQSYAAGYQIPGTIASDCSADVTQPIMSWIASVPDNSALSFGGGACYRIDGTLTLTNRNGLVLEGNGATFKATTPGSASRSQWRLIRGAGLVLRSMTVRGSNTSPGQFRSDLQWQHGIDIHGTAQLEVDRVDIVTPYGDCIYIGQPWGSSNSWASNIHVHDGSCSGAGRQGIAVTAGRDVLVERTRLDRIALNVFDVEPNGTGFGASNLTFRNNGVVGPFGHSFFALIGDGPVDYVTVAGNTLTRDGMNMTFRAPQGQRRSNVAVVGNSSDTGHYAPGSAALMFERMDGIAVTGNTIPLSGDNMALARVSESCDVNITGNSFAGGMAEARISPFSCTSTPPPSTTPPPTTPLNQPPTVDLIAPVAGAVFSSGLTMSADARDDNAVSKVEFSANNKKLNTDYSAPYSYTWSAPKQKSAYGQYTITAKAFDAAGLSASDSVIVTRLKSTSATLQISGGRTARISSSGGADTRRVYGRITGAGSGWLAIRLERLDRFNGGWVRAGTRKLRLDRRGKFRAKLHGLRSGRWRATAMFAGAADTAPSESPPRNFFVG